jgi:outer membrane protein OmpA-like peptidoglycan-associated protein
MALNSEIRIEIQGHVNAPGMENSGRIKSLSEKRAKAVKSFLKDNGIDGSRLEIMGYGNTEMIYPEPKSVEEEEANRRVEIKIIN